MDDYYVWKAQYFDDTVIAQYKQDGSATKWEELDFDKIKYWILEPVKEGYKRIVLFLNGSKRPIFWRTTVKALHSPIEIVYYKFGWQETKKGENLKVLNFVYPTGDIEQLIDSDTPQLLQSLLNEMERQLRLHIKQVQDEHK